MTKATVPSPIGDVTRGEVPNPVQMWPEFLDLIERQKEGLVAFTVSDQLWVFVSDPELADEVFRLPPPFLDVGPGPLTEVFSVSGGFGDSLAMNFSPSWRPRRVIIQRPLSHRNVRDFGETMALMSLQHVSAWHEAGTIDVGRAMSDLTLDILAEALFSGDVLEAKLAVVKFDRIRNDDFRAASASPDIVPGATAEFAAAVRSLDELIAAMIDQRRRDTSIDDILAMLVRGVDEQGNALDDVAIRDEAVTLIYAGHTTTANTLTFAASLLGRNPGVFDQLCAGVEARVGDRLPTVDDIQAIPLVGEIVEETMRLYPVAYWIDRRARVDLELGSHLVPAGTGMLFSPWLSHHDSRYFPDPERFDPERFSRENRDTIPRFAYFPFGAGPKMCAGNHLALLEASFALATLAQRSGFELLDQEPPLLHHTPLIEPRDPILARIWSR